MVEPTIDACVCVWRGGGERGCSLVMAGGAGGAGGLTGKELVAELQLVVT